MSKLRLVGLTRERDIILDALAASNAVSIKEAPALECAATVPDAANYSDLSDKIERVEGCIAVISRAVEKRKDKGDKGLTADGFSVEFSEFIHAGSYADEAEEIIARTEELSALSADANGEITRVNARKRELLPFLGVQDKLSCFKDTRLAKVRLGTIPAEKERELKELCERYDTLTIESYGYRSDSAAVLVAVHASEAEGALSDINSLGFRLCPFFEDKTAAELDAEFDDNIAELTRRRAEAEDGLSSMGDKLRTLKVYADYLIFQREKASAAEKFPMTKTAFVLEAYVPRQAQDAVLCAINGVSEYVYTEFAPIEEGDMPPTLMKNNKVVKNFEFVTNMYTPPHYGEFDPNGIMSIFFSIFLGFIMADIGYGILMMAIGFIFAARQKRDTGMKRLMNVIGYGGIFTLIFGVLFGSFFGFAATPNDINSFSISFLPKPIIPDAQGHNSTLAGISIPTVLLIALGMGVIQLMASNLCKAWSEFRRGRVADGIFFGVIWAVFLLGMLLFVLGMIVELNMGYLALPGGIIAVASLLVGAVTAGMHEKGLGKFTKGFGAIYGIINYLSDILSYARLYGLMLSGAIIAQIASGQGWLLVTSGKPVFAVLGVLVMIIGHAFNLAMGLLGAYIHDARLQYIEFFSRFYGGEGELFVPLGSARKYIYLERRAAAN